MINVYIGAMGSGKSAKLIGDMASLGEVNESEMMAFKPRVDTRDGGFIKSRNGLSRKAIEVEDFEEIYFFIYDENVKYVFIDEIQFLKFDGFLDFYTECKKNNISVFMSGLDLTSEIEPFNTTANILCYADKIEVVRGVCKCGKSSRLTRLRSGAKSGEVLVGGDEIYEGVCEKCHQFLK